MGPAPGWYPDPTRRARLRWWTGTEWTPWESDGGAVRSSLDAPTTPQDGAGAQDGAAGQDRAAPQDRAAGQDRAASAQRARTDPAIDTAGLVERLSGGPEGPARSRTDGDPAGWVRAVLLPEARRRALVDDASLDALGRLAVELTGPTATTGSPSAPGVAPGGTPGVNSTAVPTTHAAAPYPTTHPAAPYPTAHALAQHPPTTAHQPVAPYSPTPAHAPAHGTGPATAPTVPTSARPGPVRRWWSTVRERLDEDLTVHGLAYLGVLLLFVGVFGLVAFAFGDVAPALRPVAELAVALTPFAAAKLLARSGAVFVARTMVAVGALLLPLMVVTSTVDGYGFPPDLHGFALPIGTGLACAALAVAYALRARRRPASGLAVMVAPVVWFAAGMGSVGLARPIPTGEDVAVPGSAQTAVMALAVLGTTLVARLLLRAGASEGRRALAASALTAARPGAVVVAVLAVVSWVAEGAPLVPVVVTVAALAVTFERVPQVRAVTADVVLVLAWLVALVRVLEADDATPLLSADLPVAGAAVGLRGPLVLVLVVAGCALAEVLRRRVRELTVPEREWSGLAYGALVAALPVVAVIGVLGPAATWWGVAAAGVLAAWAAWRRATPPQLPGAAPVLDVVAVVAPWVVVAGVWHLVDGRTALLVAAVLALTATRLTGARFRRSADDVLWRWWWAGAVGAALAGSVLLALTGGSVTGGITVPVEVPVAAAVIAAAVALGPLTAPTTVLLTAPVLWWAWLATCLVVDPGPVVAAGVPAAVGLVVVVVVHALRLPGGSRVAGAAGLGGHATGAVAVLFAALDGLATTLALAAGTAGWLLTALAGERGRSPVAALADRAGPVGRLGPAVLALAGVPVTTSAVLHMTGVLQLGSPWWGLVPSAVALGYAVLTRTARRLPLTGRTARLGRVLRWGAFALTVIAVVIATTDRALVTALASVVLVVGVVRRRHPVMVWTAWATLTPLVAVTAQTASPAVRSLQDGVLTLGALLGVGGLLAVGALLADRRGPGSPRVVPRRRAAFAPFVLGALQLVLGIAGSMGAPADDVTVGVLLAIAAVATGLVAAVGGVGAIGTAAVLLAWVAGGLLLGPDHPGAWGHIATAVAMLAVALGIASGASPADRPRTDRLRTDHSRTDGLRADGLRADHPWTDHVPAAVGRAGWARWARWDVPLAVGAALPALTALAAATSRERPVVFVVVGVLAVGAAVRLARRRVLSEALGVVGTLLVLVGTSDAGAGWAAAALAVLAVSHTTLAAVRETGPWRTARQWVGALAAGAAWSTGLATFGWSAQAEVDVTAVGAAAVTLGIVVAVATRRLGLSWAVPWGSAGGALAVLPMAVPLLAAASDDATGNRDRSVAELTADGLVAVPSWWFVAAWVLLTVTAVLAARPTSGRITETAAPATGPVTAPATGSTTALAPGSTTWPASAPATGPVRTGAGAGSGRALWRDVAVGPALLAVVTGLLVARTTSLGRVTVLLLVTVGAAVALVVLARVQRRTWLRPLTLLGTGAVVVAAWFALLGSAVDAPTVAVSRGVLFAAVLASSSVLVAASGVAWRVVGLRLAAPGLAWLAWVAYAADAIDGVAAWYTVPVGLALLAVVGVWRADRRDRGLPPSDGVVVALELTGIAFLVVASFVAALTEGVLHALVAAGVGVVVVLWGLLTRVRRRLLAGGVVVLAGVVVAVAAPLVALLPAWGEAGVWVLVAVVGLVVVLAATMLERGRAVVREGRARLVDATHGWE